MSKIPPKKDAAMKAKELQELLDFIAKSGLNKVNIETEEFKISVQREPGTKQVVSMSAAPAAPAPAAVQQLPPWRPTPHCANGHGRRGCPGRQRCLGRQLHAP